MKILVADDDDAIRQLLSLELHSLGHEVIEAADGAEAVAIALREKPDLVLLDVLMPRLNGFNVLQELRSSGFGGKAVFVTALTTSHHRELEPGGEADGVLNKPFRLQDVAQCLERLQAS